MSKRKKHQKAPAKQPEAIVTHEEKPEAAGEQPVPEAPVASADKKQIPSDFLRQLCRRYWAKKLFTIPAGILVFLGVLAAVPFTRYTLLGAVMKEDVTITVVDSKTNSPVSKATVVLDGHSVTTGVAGKATLHARVGYRTLSVDKKYYQSYGQSRLVSLSKTANTVTVKIVALGRLVPVTVLNKLTGKPVAGATVKALNADAVTAADGTATLVLPAEASLPQVSVAMGGYNTLSGKITVTDQKVAANTFSITPAGKLYFLSNLSGKIDVVKTDLDGSNRQTVLAGTGNESLYGTTLLASRDWKYLALYAQRTATGNSEIDLIDTSTDKLTNIDEGNASFSLIGWDNDKFIYQVNRNNISAWQNGQQALKSFDASTKSITVLAQTAASGTQYNYQDQSLGSVYIVNGKVVYALNWYQGPYTFFNGLAGKQATLNAVNPDGSGATVIKSFGQPGDGNWYNLYFAIRPYDDPNTLAVSMAPTGTGQGTAYYTYTSGKLAAASDMTDQNFYSGDYATYLQSPSGQKLFWSVNADGQNSLKVGDSDAQNAKTILTSSDYGPYGWFTDGYVLLQKSGNELYIMPADGSAQPFKITNYYKPRANYYGYGGGYGGL